MCFLRVSQHGTAWRLRKVWAGEEEVGAHSVKEAK